MKEKILTIEEGLAEGRKLPFAFLRFLDKTTLGKTPDSVNTDTLLEARFFDEKTEVRIFRREDDLCAALLQEEDTDRLLVKTYAAADKKFGSKITVKCDLSSDEDGQTFVKSVRLSHWEGGEGNV